MLLLKTVCVVFLVFGSSISELTVIASNLTDVCGYSDVAGICLCSSVTCSSNHSSIKEPAGEEPCKCDPECRLYNDCCYNFTETFQTELPSSPKPNHYPNMNCIATRRELRTNLLQNLDEQVTTGYFMVDRCPMYYSYPVIRDLCNLADSSWLTSPPEKWSDYGSHIPVIDKESEISYKNRYCAWCNGVSFDNIQLWDLVTECSWNVVSPRDCYSVSVVETAVESAKTRSCIVQDKTECPTDVDGALAQLCKSYNFPVVHYGTTYRNPHCALCNDPSVNGSSVCPAIDIGHILKLISVPLFLPFDFYSKLEPDLDDSTPRCSTGFFYNSSLHECFPLYPETNYWELCPQTAEAVTLLYIYPRYVLNVEAIIPITLDYFGLLAGGSKTQQTNCDDSGDNKCLRLDIETTETFTPHNVSIKQIYGLFAYLSSRIEIEHINVSISCVETKKGESDDYCEDVITRSVPFQNSALYSTGTTLIIKDEIAKRVYYISPLQVSVTISKAAAEQNELNVTFYFCPASLSEDIDCPYYILPADEVTSFPDYIENNISTENFLLAENGSVHVCLLPTNNLGFLFVTYIVFSSLSIFLLSVAFLTYCLFKFLRNGPGKLAMNFFVALAISQLLLLVGVTQTQNPAVCTIFAISGHYTLLVVFLWTSIISYSVSRTFGGAMVCHKSNYSVGKLLTIMTIGWGIPAILVCACVIVWYLDVSHVVIEYGNSNGCWIRPGKVNLLIFGIPAMSCLFFNFIMFGWASMGIRRSMRAAKRVHENKSSAAAVKEEVILYVKVSILMGFCWIWAFLSGLFPSSVVLLLLQTIFIPLQGTLVFFIYICNRRMLSKWRTALSEVVSTDDGSLKLTRLFSGQHNGAVSQISGNNK
ncbi:uncharacterized protein [Apostichopus japonicus]|uniref:uncharacterized protein n=1 Tax=Stichopus japonicus TaxID=307972 RepID=UPI003AB51265